MGRTDRGDRPRRREGNSPEALQSIERVFRVLRCFGSASPRLTASEVSASTGLDRAVVRRYLASLMALGYVRQNGQLFYLRPKVLEIGYAYLSSLELPEIAQPHLTRLAWQLKESCSVTVLDGHEVAYVAVANAERELAIRLSVGNRLPAHCTAMGRVLLSGLQDADVKERLGRHEGSVNAGGPVLDIAGVLETLDVTRQRGWAVGDQELVPGIRSISVPLRGPSCELMAALTVSTPTSRVNLDDLKGAILASLQAAARDIETHLSR